MDARRSRHYFISTSLAAPRTSGLNLSTAGHPKPLNNFTANGVTRRAWSRDASTAVRAGHGYHRRSADSRFQMKRLFGILPAKMNIVPGTRFGRYEIRSKLGEGGMGEVYSRPHTQLDRDIALKLSLPK